MSNTFIKNEFECAFDCGAIGMAIVSLDGHVTRANQALLDLIGCSADEMQSKSLGGYSHPEELDLETEALKQVIAGETKSYKLDKRYISTSGEVLWTNINVSLIYCEKKNPKSLIYQIQDISRRKKAEEANQLILESTYDGYWDWYPQAEYQYMSPRFWEMLGYDYKDKKSSPNEWQKIIFPEDLKRTLDNYHKHVETKGEHPFYQEVRYRHQNGSTVWVICKGKLIQWDSDGSPLRMVGTHTDITELKTIHLALADQSKLLSLGRMAGGIAHEINNPLSIILGYVNILEAKAESDFTIKSSEVLANCNSIEQTCFRISKIIGALRQYSKDTKKDKKEHSSVNKLIEDTLAMCKEKFKSTGVEIEIDINEQARGELFCRPTEISQVLLNLLNNSYDAISGLKDKWIRIEYSEDLECSIIKIVDSGKMELAQGEVQKIFQPFFSTKAVGQGTGLGLSICQATVESHHGSLVLDLDSKNTQFVIKLPLQREA